MLSIAIITCNRLDQFCQAVQSCENHIKGPWELVIVDNHSTDGTKEWINNYHFTNDVSLNYTYLNENKGVALARNIAYKNASGDIVYFIDDDATIDGTADCLNKAYEYMNSDKNIVLMGTEIYDHKIKGLLVEIPQKNKPLETGTIMRGYTGGSHFIKKSVVGNVALYPDFIFYGGEELYLSYKCYDKGGLCVYYNAFRVEHFPSMKTRLTEKEMKISRYCNAYSFRKTIMPALCVPVATFFYMINVVNGFKLDVSAYVECQKRIVKRNKVQYRISYKTVRKLVNYFGVIKVFK